ncbi:MAG: hypothetical protein KC656_10360, partial [Myxococcales bacterium]|nr:hypothetical protein [Myxococcales bacterium]
ASTTVETTGSGSPIGRALVGWSWSLASAPVGSAAVLVPAGTTAELEVDVAGAYRVEVVATDEDGRDSPPCVAAATAVPHDLVVELTWDQPGDDLDLHLLAPGGVFGTALDCYFANCGVAAPSPVDWGVPGVAIDDPLLEADDAVGTGPERTRLRRATPGTYTIVVYDFGTDPGILATQATVDVYVSGLLAGSITRTLLFDGVQHTFATVELPAGLVTEIPPAP